jgi:AcrR family transcriptional regulator
MAEPMRSAGRPRSSDVDEAILRAAVGLLESAGAGAISVNAVARRSGVARASIYLRYGGRDALVAAAIRNTIGREPIPVTGDLERDLHRAAEQVRSILSSAGFLRIFPRLVAGLLEDRGSPASITYEMLAPNRALLVDEYRAIARESGLRADVDSDVAIDLLIGGMLNRLLVTGRIPSAAEARQVVEILLDGLRVRERGA